MSKPQKAKHFYLEAEKVKPHYIGKQYMVFEKHDGWYGYMDPDRQIMSRNMRAIPSLAKRSEDLVELEGRLIFEVLVLGVPEFKDLNGILNRHAICEDVHLRVHDYLIPGDYRFEDRYAAAEEYVRELNHPYVDMANRLGTFSSEHWQTLAEHQWSLGNEGIVMKELNHKYAYGSRIGSLLKIKEELTLDLLVVAVQVGEGKYSNTVGSLIVKEKSGLTHSISGMTDAERDLWWLDPSQIIGRVVEVKAMKRLANGSLREPRFKAIRYDKDEID